MYTSYWHLHEIEYLRGNYKESIKWLNDLIAVNSDVMHHKFMQDADSVLDRKSKIYAKMVQSK